MSSNLDPATVQAIFNITDRMTSVEREQTLTSERLWELVQLEDPSVSREQLDLAWDGFTRWVTARFQVGGEQ